ncbi:hypothetical protein AXF42_Ash000890 [Apostasia shenzhenica]|uniref:C2 domain-containing protein n=1 Tax=Apostasia shenzhenica TaxID=1088818 RepID=A0A2I0ATD0_9ASPA|nr:hypothetical protein AXF42_Ash000890 [Apostasia shenzhenica]
MGSRYELELTIRSARDLKNVNWRNGDLRSYAVAWVDPSAKCSTKVDVDNDTNPVWDEKLTIPLPPSLSLRDATLFIDVVHANAGEDTKPLIGSARLSLNEVVDEAGIGVKLDKTLKLKRPSGRPHGKLDVRVAVKEPARYYAPPPTAAAYGQPYGSRDYGAGGYRDPYGYAPQAGYPYGGPPPQAGYSYNAPPPTAAPPAGYPYSAPPAGAPPAGYAYGGQQPAYGQTAVPAGASGKKSKFGMGTGLAVGAAAGVLGGLALAEGADYLEDKFEDHVADKVEDDFADDYGGDDF